MLLLTGAAAAVFYVSVVRTARGLPVYTAGLPRATLTPGRPGRAVYDVQLTGPAERYTPAGTPSVAHHWEITPRTRPSVVLCHGSATDGVMATDATGTRPLALPLPSALYTPSEPRPVPERLLAVCPAAFAMDPATLVYTEQAVRPGTLANVAACIEPGRHGALIACNDGAPSRVYARESPARARARIRQAMLKVSGCAGLFALVCFTAGLLALYQFDRVTKEKERQG